MMAGPLSAAKQQILHPVSLVNDQLVWKENNIQCPISQLGTVMNYWQQAPDAYMRYSFELNICRQ